LKNSNNKSWEILGDVTNLPYHSLLVLNNPRFLTTKHSPNSSAPTSRIRTNANWNDESLKKTKAMDKGAKINMAIHHFRILKSFLKDHLNGKNKF
jgi:hypothetical protein